MNVIGLVLLTGFGGAVFPQEDPLTASVTLKNGSVLRGALRTLSEIHLKTKYGTLKIPTKDVWSIRWGRIRKEERDTVTTVNGAFHGWIEGMNTLEVDTGYGTLKIPPTAIRSLRIWRKGKGLGDDFESGLLDRWTPYGGTWRIADGALQATAPGNYQNVILYNEELPDRYVLEAEIKGNNMVAILWHAQSQVNAVGLWIYPGQLSVYSGSGTFYSQVAATWATAVPSGPNTIRIEVNGASATVSLNEKKLGTVTTQLTKGKVGFFLYSGQATFDNLRITPK